MIAAAFCVHCLTPQFPEAERSSVGDLTISTAGDCEWRGKPLRLTIQEARIVYVLASAAGAWVPTPQLVKAIGSHAADPSNIIGVLVHRARGKFRSVDPGFDRLESVRRSGYRWRVEPFLS